MKTIQECRDFRTQLMEKIYTAFPSTQTNPMIKMIADGPIVFNPRMRTVTGRARYRENKIFLNVRLLTEHPQEFDPTFVHELAHLLAFRIYQDRGHGRGWKMIMRVLGYPPDRCHTLDVKHLKRTHPPVAIAKCVCRERIEIKRKMFNNMRMGFHYVCKTCRTRLVLIGRVNP